MHEISVNAWHFESPTVAYFSGYGSEMGRVQFFLTLKISSETLGSCFDQKVLGISFELLRGSAKIWFYVRPERYKPIADIGSKSLAGFKNSYTISSIV